MKKLLPIFIFIIFGGSLMFSQTYIGSDQCQLCHDNVDSNTGYNIWEEYITSGHPYKLNEVSGSPPVYPPNTSPGVPDPPPGTAWGDYSYVIGGYGWKARFVLPTGRIFTATQEVQYNLETQGWVAYHFGEDKKYNYGCFQCHTTGPSETGSWNGVPGDSLGTFSEPGVRCEGCHGPGSTHASTASAADIDKVYEFAHMDNDLNGLTYPDGTTKTPDPAGDDVNFLCGTCHNRSYTSYA